VSHLIGQPSVKEQIIVAVDSAQQDNRKFDHALLVGPPGMGKTAAAQIIAAEMATDFLDVLGQSLRGVAGLNLPHYPVEVKKIITVEPNAGMNRLAVKRIRESGFDVDQRLISGEHLPFDNDRFDCVVSTFTLCSVGDADRVVSELHRVLKPGGAFLFLEHGLSPNATVQMWQHRLNPLEMWFADGCRLDRDMKQLIVAQPFSSVESQEFYLEKTPKTHGYLYRGEAV
jgi:SAM-dependent methyltransferase